MGQLTVEADDSDYRVVLVTAPNESEAESLAGDLLSKKLAACVNIFPVQSTYLWEGKVQCDREYQLIIKTTAERFQMIEQRILELHSYEVPEIISLPVQQGSSSYLSWIADTVSPE
ncbi:MAG: divalent-cation tolerance protein CutA [Acaryochloridaceae cyanobacterium RL_2_7]|nr:divalent-cation tolerance protein CutA [Acaryochloridaceae cyanobacterium RL_2_7]